MELVLLSEHPHLMPLVDDLAKGDSDRNSDWRLSGAAPSV
jgi:hypothetical protein